MTELDHRRRWQAATAILFLVAMGAAATAYGLRTLQARADHSVAAGATLRYLALRMDAFRTAAIVDQDGDGRGEYPFLAELTGLAPPRTDTGVAAAPCGNFLVRTILGESALAGGGIAVKEGYCFRVFLPAGAPWQPDPGRPADGDRAAADAQETCFAVYAWPAEVGSGDVVLHITEQHVLLRAANIWGFAGRERAPQPSQARLAAPPGGVAPDWLPVLD